jgi:hypothetical protein
LKELEWGEHGPTPLTATEHLDQYWTSTDLWPAETAHRTTIDYENGGMDPDDQPYAYREFCPEVTLDRFSFAASNLHKYRSETEREVAHGNLRKENAPASDWRWSWSDLAPMHYTECPLYSMLPHAQEPPPSKGTEEGSYSEADEHLHRIVGANDFKALTNAELWRRHRLSSPKLFKRTRPFTPEGFRSSANRVRLHHGYPKSGDIRRKKTGQP